MKHMIIGIILICLAHMAYALDCDQHLQIGFKLHDSKHSRSLTKDTDLLEKIRGHYETALKQCPDRFDKQPKHFNNLGDVCKRLGDHDAAIQYFQKALKLDASLCDASFELGVIYENRGLYGMAVEQYMADLSCNASDTEARNRLIDVVKHQNCRMRTAEPGQHLGKDDIYDSLICPKVFKAAKNKFAVERGIVFVSYSRLRNILFDTGKARIQSHSFTQLNDVIAMLNQHAQMTIFVDGHTDQVPVNRRLEVRDNVFCTSNQCLSEKRAASVRQYLVQQGVASNRIISRGFGASQIIDPNNDAKNRRVELRAR